MTQTISERLSEMKDAAGLSNRKLAELSGIPEGTVNKIMSGQTEKPSFEAVQALVSAVGRSMDEISGEKKDQTPQGQVLDHYVHIIQAYKDQVGIYREQQRSHKRAIYILFGCLVAVMIVVFFVLIYDITHPNMGYVRY